MGPDEVLQAEVDINVFLSAGIANGAINR
jgi:hypothetical protein